MYNLGSGNGVSVREIMTAIAEVTGIAFEPRIAPRRSGDPAIIVASGELAARDLDWQMRHSLNDMVLLGLGGPRSLSLTEPATVLPLNSQKFARIW